MANPTIITGKDVAVNGVPNGGRVDIQRTVKGSPLSHSSGSGGSDRPTGNIDFVGRYMAWGHTPQVFPNDIFALAFTLDGSADSSGLGATVRCLGTDIIVPPFDPRQRNGVYYLVYFGAHGADLAAGGATTGAATAILSTKSLGCTIASAAQTAVQSMKLSFHVRAHKEPYLTSSGVFTRPSGDIDWRFQCRRNISSMALAPALNAIGALNMYVTDALSWDMTYGRVVDVEGAFDRQDRIRFIDIAAEKCEGADGAVGTIVTPGGVTVWPG